MDQIIAVLAAAACLVITISIWRSVGAGQEMWPLPALYFIEVMGLASVCAAVFALGNPARTVIAWGTAGVFAAFGILGAWTVGLAYLPMALMFLVAGIISDLRQHGDMAAHTGTFLIAGLAQAAGMLMLLRAF